MTMPRPPFGKRDSGLSPPSGDPPRTTWLCLPGAGRSPSPAGAGLPRMTYIPSERLPGEQGVFTSGLIACRNAVSDSEKLDNGCGHLRFIPNNQLLPSREWYAPGLVSLGERQPCLASPGGDHGPGRTRQFPYLCVFRGMEPVSMTAAFGDCEAWQPLFSHHLGGKSPRATLGSCRVRPPGDAERSGHSILLLPSRAQIPQGVMTESWAGWRHNLSG